MANQIETFSPVVVPDKSDNLGSVRTQQYTPEAMEAMSPTNTASAHLPEVSFTSANIPNNTDRGELADLRRRQQAPPPEAGELPPPPTADEIGTMNARAAEGRLDNDTARLSAALALQNGGTRGLAEFRDQMNAELERSNSDYRARIARVDGPDGVINLYMVLHNQRNNENLNNVVRDLHENGTNSQYRGRAVHIQLTPQRRPDV